jgi:hypothetical protein
VASIAWLPAPRGRDGGAAAGRRSTPATDRILRAERDPAQYDGPIPPHQDPDGPAELAASDIVGLLAEDARLRVVAAVVLGAGSMDEVVGATGLAVREAAVALDRLRRGGLIVAGEGGLRVAAEALRRAARVPAGPRPEGTGSPEEQVLRIFVRDGELVSIPAARAKRLVVLEWLAARFEPGRTYPEAETNRLLREAHPDHAALRRYLVDEGFLERRDSFYWRAGGAFDTD